ncbi:glycosyltransferase domain-containing protein [Dongia deserti]|uniref:glycosyltransferase domain-containing protein n=1 Tax=Dongia deserti TaxID=2268030 RepID=UPI000E648E7A|nr:glycosyltransferase domain-containing protein [Dongia deserti]
MLGAEAELRAVRIEAAILLDRALRLESLAVAAEDSIGSRILRSIETCASALRSTVKQSDSKPRKRNPDAGRHAAVLLKSGLFDPEYYLRRNPDVAIAGANPVMHYLAHGASELRDPGPCFSTSWYLARYPDVAESGDNPLYHFILRGYSEGRLPVPSSDADRRLISAQSCPGSAASAPVGVAGSKETGTREKGGRLVVYTALFGDYDDLFVPSPEQAERCDFVVFTDRQDVPAPWRRGPVCYAAPNRFKQNRFYKLLPHRLFPDYEWSLYLDGNIDLRIDPVEFLERYCSAGPDFFVFRHPRRQSILEELAACIELRKDDAELMVRQVARYFEHGFRHAFTLTENNVLLRRHNDPELAALGEAWWEEVRSKSQRDQLSLSHVVEKQGYKGIALFEDGRATARYYPGLTLRPHRAQSCSLDQADDSVV